MKKETGAYKGKSPQPNSQVLQRPSYSETLIKVCEPEKLVSTARYFCSKRRSHAFAVMAELPPLLKWRDGCVAFRAIQTKSEGIKTVLPAPLLISSAFYIAYLFPDGRWKTALKGLVIAVTLQERQFSQGEMHACFFSCWRQCNAHQR